MSADYPRVEFRSAQELHDWLTEHHASSPGIWLVTWKKNRGPYLPYVEMVRELLCFGWIDSKGQRVDEDRTSLLACPRRPGSGWSRINKEHLELLREQGRIQPAGQAAIDRAVADGSWTKLDEAGTLREPDDLHTALDAAPQAREHWDGFPPVDPPRDPGVDHLRQDPADPRQAGHPHGRGGCDRSARQPEAATERLIENGRVAPGSLHPGTPLIITRTAAVCRVLPSAFGRVGRASRRSPSRCRQFSSRWAGRTLRDRTDRAEVE